jgi:hypothetical protein
MSKRTPKKIRITNSLPTIHLNAAAVDIGSNEHWVAVPADREHSRCGGSRLSRTIFTLWQTG